MVDHRDVLVCLRAAGHRCRIGWVRRVVVGRSGRAHQGVGRRDLVGPVRRAEVGHPDRTDRARTGPGRCAGAYRLDRTGPVPPGVGRRGRTGQVRPGAAGYRVDPVHPVVDRCPGGGAGRPVACSPGRPVADRRTGWRSRRKRLWPKGGAAVEIRTPRRLRGCGSAVRRADRSRVACAVVRSRHPADARDLRAVGRIRGRRGLWVAGRSRGCREGDRSQGRRYRRQADRNQVPHPAARIPVAERPVHRIPVGEGSAARDPVGESPARSPTTGRRSTGDPDRAGVCRFPIRWNPRVPARRGGVVVENRRGYSFIPPG